MEKWAWVDPVSGIIYMIWDYDPTGTIPAQTPLMKIPDDIVDVINSQWIYDYEKQTWYDPNDVPPYIPPPPAWEAADAVLQQQINDLNTATSGFHGSISSMSQSISDLSGSVTNMGTSLGNMQTDVNQCKSDVSANNTRVDTLAASTSANTANITALQTNLGNTQTQMNNMKENDLGDQPYNGCHIYESWFLSPGTAVWTCPETGFYRVTIQGGGSAGQSVTVQPPALLSLALLYCAGAGGNSGRCIELVNQFQKGQSYNIVVGAGGIPTQISNLSTNEGGQSSFGLDIAQGGPDSGTYVWDASILLSIPDPWCVATPQYPVDTERGFSLMSPWRRQFPSTMGASAKLCGGDASGWTIPFTGEGGRSQLDTCGSFYSPAQESGSYVSSNDENMPSPAILGSGGSGAFCVAQAALILPAPTTATGGNGGDGFVHIEYIGNTMISDITNV